MQRASFVYLFVATVDVIVAAAAAVLVGIVVAAATAPFHAPLLPITICVFHTFAVHFDSEKLHRV